MESSFEHRAERSLEMAPNFEHQLGLESMEPSFEHRAERSLETALHHGHQFGLETMESSFEHRAERSLEMAPNFEHQLGLESMEPSFEHRAERSLEMAELGLESSVNHRQKRGLLNGLLCDVSRLCLNLDLKANLNLCCRCNSQGTYIKLKNECHRKMASCLLSSLSSGLLSPLLGLTVDLPVVDAKLCL
ncbi:uncharacterized protein LOC120349800 [Nilaparvata lugens]|uniref:uncharacterized protein LOC120349800 n=1 Tax=Nilaparvata lugens TaxID=108931 RepID=UPI00193DD627|nr:uncharacterized protein LOC120349800 [Nilaparvata lugens]